MIEMMQLSLHQVSWPAILDLKSVGTGPSPRRILLPFRGNFFCFSSGVFEILESDLFRDNFFFDGTLFLWRGKWPVQCHVIGCARNRNASFVVLSCASDMTAWLKHKQKGSGVSGKKRKNWRCQSYRWFKISVRDHIRAQMAFIVI